MGDQYCLTKIVKETPSLFTSFNKRYLSLLPITINSLIILSKNNQISITISDISLKKEVVIEGLDLGTRFNDIVKVLPNLIEVINKYTTTQLYQILDIKL